MSTTNDFITYLRSFFPSKSEKHYKWTSAIWAITFGVTLFFIGFITFLTLFRTPSFDELERPDYDLASFIYDDKSEVIGKYFVENREKLSYAQINPVLIKSLIAVEDERFYQHDGR